MLHAPGAQYMPADKIQPGQIIAYVDRPRTLVLRANEPYTERLPGVLGSREISAHWCRIIEGERAGEEGWIPFGPGGQFPVEISGDRS